MITLTVLASTISVRSYGPSWSCDWPALTAGSTTRSRVNLTASALNGVPSWNFTPCLSLNVYCFASGVTSHESASPGTNLPGSGSQTNGSHTFRVMRMVESKLVTCGSSVSSTSKLSPYARLPPAPAASGATAGATVGAAAGAAAAVGLATGAAVAA